MFVEVGPKKALQGFAEDVLGATTTTSSPCSPTTPSSGDLPSFNAALCGLYAAGLGYPGRRSRDRRRQAGGSQCRSKPRAAPPAAGAAVPPDRYSELGHMLADFARAEPSRSSPTLTEPARRGRGTARPRYAPGPVEPVVITGAALGLPGVERVFDDENVARILRGQQFIDVIPPDAPRDARQAHHPAGQERPTATPVFETIEGEADVIKLAGRSGPLDAVEEFGLDPDRDAALDAATRLAIGAGIDALRDAGIPLVRHYHTTTLGTQLPGPLGPAR